MDSPKNDVYALAKEQGSRVEWEQTGSLFIVQIDAPVGSHFSDGCVHSFRFETRPTRAQHRDEVWIDALRRMRAGLEPCDPNQQDCADNAENAGC